MSGAPMHMRENYPAGARRSKPHDFGGRWWHSERMNPMHGFIPRPQFAIVIDEDRKKAGWGNHFAVVQADRPKDYIFLGGEDEAERRVQHLNRPRVMFGRFVGLSSH